jgi:transcription initiation factor TFIID TATA-box-binding protein
MFLELNSNSNITYYNNVYGNSNSNSNIETNPIQNLLNNHNKEFQNKTNEINNSILKEESTKLGTNDINIPQPKIVNIVSMVHLGTKLNLRHIALQCSNSEYKPSRINAVIMRIKKPKSAALIFNTGVIICLGAKNEEDSRKSAKIFAHNIKNLGYENVKFKKFQLINIVATCDLKFPIKLTKLNLKLNAILGKNHQDKKLCFYEPDTFPGLIYHMRKPELTVLVFKSGKVNFVGAKNRQDIFEALQKIYPLLCKYKNEIIINKDKSEDESEVEFSNLNNL